MEVPVCPYCNRLYITALKRKKVRPQLDHFFPKSKYPKIRKALDQLHYPSFRVNMVALQNIGHIIPMLIIQFGQVESLDLLLQSLPL